MDFLHKIDPMIMLVLKCSNAFPPSLVSEDVLNHTFHVILITQPVDSHVLTAADNLPLSALAVNHLPEM
jgi:hypothetical protein